MPIALPSHAFSAESTPYDALGGESVVRAIAAAFYDEMDANPAYRELRALHDDDDLTESKRVLFIFLSGWLGGPQLYMQERGHPRLRMRHAHVPITPAMRDQWLGCMAAALDQCDVTGDVRTFLDQRFTHVANFLVNA